MFMLVVLLLPGHMWGSIRVHHLWACPCLNQTCRTLLLLKWSSAIKFTANTLSLTQNPTCLMLWKTKLFTLWQNDIHWISSLLIDALPSETTHMQFWECHLLENSENLFKVLIGIQNMNKCSKKNIFFVLIIFQLFSTNFNVRSSL